MNSKNGRGHAGAGWCPGREFLAGLHRVPLASADGFGPKGVMLPKLDRAPAPATSSARYRNRAGRDDVARREAPPIHRSLFAPLPLAGRT